MHRRRRTRHRYRGRNYGQGMAQFLLLLLLILVLLLPSPFAAVPGKPDAAPAPTPRAEAAPVTVKVYDHKAKTTFTMDLEEYTLGVLSGEMPASYEPEALKAQAVAARTYTYRKMESGGCGRGGAQVCTDSTHCQAYCSMEERKAKWKNNFTAYENKLTDAVTDTKGQVLLYEGKPIAAFFHAVAGGQTEDVINVWGGNLPYLKSVPSTGEESATRFTGTVTVTYDAFRSKIRSIRPGAKVDDVQKSIGSIARTDAGRVKAIVIGGETISGNEMRTLFGLNSTNFTIRCSGKKVQFDTRGYGHGVGMSQVGALSMAKNGADYKTILLHYYTGVELGTIPAVK
ncbi:MAG: stage II sporulation protein D [Clostridiales bacterium]|nr:stage II sporulation protein D [Clostridiales bacterium]